VLTAKDCQLVAEHQDLHLLGVRRPPAGLRTSTSCISDRLPRSISESAALPKLHSISLRWILLHMIEQDARHNGHADLLRHRINGPSATGILLVGPCSLRDIAGQTLTRDLHNLRPAQR
jgi:hypothetical protein